MFDLPTTKKEDRRKYTEFRKQLISNGYIMLQYSVYVRMFPNKTSAMQSLKKIKSITPPNGAVRAMLVTEAQYQATEILVGGKSYQEDNVTSEPLTIL